MFTRIVALLFILYHLSVQGIQRLESGIRNDPGVLCRESTCSFRPPGSKGSKHRFAQKHKQPAPKSPNSCIAGAASQQASAPDLPLPPWE